MKKIILLISAFVIVLLWASCETYPDWQEGIEYSDAYPLAGEWYVVDYDQAGDSLTNISGDLFPPYILYIYNKSYNPTGDSIWIDNRTGHVSGGSGDTYEYRYKIKCVGNTETLNFNCTKQGDVRSAVNAADSANTVNIINSKVIVNSTGIEDPTPDSIYFEVELYKNDGTLIGKFKTAGHRKTGWEKPEYDDDM